MTDNVKQPRTSKATEAIRYMIHLRLKTSTPGEALLDQFAAHLDEDALGAFVEGRLRETESAPVISHLVACASCRRTTAQLVRFDSQFDSGSDSTALDESPGRLRSFLERTAARATPSVDAYFGDSVVAYQIPAEQDSDVSQTPSGQSVQAESAGESKPQIEDGESDQ